MRKYVKWLTFFIFTLGKLARPFLNTLNCQRHFTLDPAMFYRDLRINAREPVAVLLSIQEYERLSRKYTGFWSALSEFLRKIEDEGIEISDSDFKGLRDLSPGREVELRGW